MNENEFEKVIPETEETVAEEPEIEEETISEEEINEEIVSDEIINDEEIGEETFSEEVVDEVTGEIIENELTSDELVEEIIEEQPVKKKKGKVILKVLVAIVLVIALIFGAVVAIFGTDLYNKFGLDKSAEGSIAYVVRNSTMDLIKGKSDNEYNNLGYANPEGRTIKDIAENLGMSVEEFLEAYSLPEDMPEDTEEMAAYYSMPVKVFAQMYGVDFATFKEAYAIPEETTPDIPRTIGDKINSWLGKHDIKTIDENTPWGEVLDELKLANYVGEENLEAFKEFYGLGDEVTVETRYKEIKRAVEEKTMQLAEEAKAAEAENSETDVTDTEVVEPETDTEENAQTEE